MFDKLNIVVLSVTRLDILTLLLMWFIAISIIGAVIVYVDKQLAINKKGRISEKFLFIVGFLGGALAEYVVMNVVRHKTLHKKFMIGLPLIAAVQFLLLIWRFFTWI